MRSTSLLPRLWLAALAPLVASILWAGALRRLRRSES
jgi:hypothetical protein